MKKCLVKSLPDQKKAAEPLKALRRLVDDGVVPPALKDFAAGKRYFIKTYGCQANIRDEEILSGFLEKAGFIKTEDPREANLAVINTCAVRENAEDKVYGEIGTFKANKDADPSFMLVLAGCVMGRRRSGRLIREDLSLYFAHYRHP
jgi:tRNA-2-methylthio-N6-dimethylallyladenosine synthase